jgi:hypothetical protein
MSEYFALEKGYKVYPSYTNEEGVEFRPNSVATVEWTMESAEREEIEVIAEFYIVRICVREKNVAKIRGPILDYMNKKEVKIFDLFFSFFY